MGILSRNMDIVAFDLEIVKSVKEVGGWQNKHLMGVSFAGIYHFRTQRYEIYDQHNLQDCQNILNSANVVVGFSQISFDYEVMKGAGYEITQQNNYDILREAWLAANLDLDNFSDAHKGFNLDNICKGTMHMGKIGDGAHAPELFQAGHIAKLVNYLLRDLELTQLLFRYIDRYHRVIVPDKGLFELSSPEWRYDTHVPERRS